MKIGNVVYVVSVDASKTVTADNPYCILGLSAAKGNVSDVKAYVKNNLSKKITLSELSWKLHCSTVTLTEHFKKEFGITIMEYVTQKRMDKAKRLLENSDLSVREISEACGFSDIEYFSRSFKGIYKMSPSAWRKTHSKVMASTVKRQRSDKKTIKIAKEVSD